MIIHCASFHSQKYLGLDNNDMVALPITLAVYSLLPELEYLSLENLALPKSIEPTLLRTTKGHTHC